MIDAAMDFIKSQRYSDTWDVVVKATIPSGSETCYFEICRGNPDEKRKWAEYTKILENKALEIASK